MNLAALQVGRIDAVVSYFGIGHRDDLTRVTRIRENLLVTGHTGIETHFAHCNPLGTAAFTFKARSIVQQQDGPLTSISQ
jgi:hypothetical protein